MKLARPKDLFHFSIISLPYIWLLFFVLLPLVFVLGISLSYDSFSQIPYEFFIKFKDKFDINPNFSNYISIFSEEIYIDSFKSSMRIAILSTIVCLFVGYPISYAIFLSSNHYKNILLAILLIPFWTSLLIRIYAWIVILKKFGLLNNLLISLGLISEPIEFLYTEFATIIGIVYTYLPFMILPIYSSLKKINNNIIEAAKDLGASTTSIFWRIILPLSRPGITIGMVIIFIVSIGEYVIPDLLGGTNIITIGKIIWGEFFFNRSWVIACSLSIILVTVIITPILFLKKNFVKEIL